tara:strand:- start:416 stop:916 length:501 start_codon:yes stop_codon:yes gene_type:complete
MNYKTYNSEEEYEAAIEAERQINPETLFDIVLPTKHMVATTGLAQGRRDFELRYGAPQWKRYGVELDSKDPIFFPAGKPLHTNKEIIAWRSKHKEDNFTLKRFPTADVKDEWLHWLLTTNLENEFRFKDFRHAYKYAQGKPAKLFHAPHVTIKADKNGIPQLHKRS